MTRVTKGRDGLRRGSTPRALLINPPKNMEQFTHLLEAVVAIACFGSALIIVETFVSIFKALTK